jgi:hypothetical protein
LNAWKWAYVMTVEWPSLVLIFWNWLNILGLVTHPIASEIWMTGPRLPLA